MNKYCSYKNEKDNDVEIEEKSELRVEEGNNSPMGEHFTGTLQGEKGKIQFVNIIGQIEGHILLPPTNKSTKYEHIIPLLIQMANDKEVDGVLFILNTVGGDVEAGLAISELIATLGKPTVSLVLGGGHSIGVPLAVSTNYSFIAESATMMLHPVRVNGLVISSEQTYKSMKKTQDRILEFILRNCDVNNERLKELMFATGEMAGDIGTVLCGEEAVNEKLINSTGGLNCAISKLYELIGEGKEKK